MAGRQRQTAFWTGLRGRDGSTAGDLDVPENKALECLNISLAQTTFARKRGGATAQSVAGSNLTGVISAGTRHVPGADELAAELWLVDDAASPVLARFAGNAWSNPAWKSAIQARPQDTNFISFNGKLFILADTAVDRLQIFNPGLSVTQLQYAGLSTPAAPVVSDTGSGSYPAVKRSYRVIFITTPSGSGTPTKRSLASQEAEFTPSGSGAGALVSRPPLINEGEAWWELYAAGPSGAYHLIATLTTTTTSYDDRGDPALYHTTGPAMPLQGDNTPIHSVKYGLTDDNRLLLAGAYETGHSQNEVWYTRVLGSTSPLYADDEVLPATNKVAFNERDSGFIVGLGGPLESNILVFKNSQTWRLIPTGIVDDPYRRRSISKTIGLLHQKTVIVAEDDTGTTTIYWLSPYGPFRYNLKSGLARLTWDVEDLWATVFRGAATIPAHGIYHTDLNEIWWWIAVGAEAEPATYRIKYNTKFGRVTEAGQVRDGWTVDTGESVKARCSFMFSRSIGPPLSRMQSPYIGQHGGAARLWRCDTPNGDDNGTPYRSTVRGPHRHYGGLLHRCQVTSPAVLGAAGTHSIAVQQSLDYGTQVRAASVSMAPAGTETRVLRVVEGVESADAAAVALEVGDATAVAGSWVLDAVAQEFEVREPVVVP